MVNKFAVATESRQGSEAAGFLYPVIPARNLTMAHMLKPASCCSRSTNSYCAADSQVVAVDSILRCTLVSRFQKGRFQKGRTATSKQKAVLFPGGLPRFGRPTRSRTPTARRPLDPDVLETVAKQGGSTHVKWVGKGTTRYARNHF